jgi:hypothetical protein
MKLQTEPGNTNAFTKLPLVLFYVAALIVMLFLSWQYERMHSKAGAGGKPTTEKAEIVRF